MESDFRSVSRVLPTFPPLCPASERGVLMNFFQNETSYAKQNKNSEESLRSMSCRVVQSKKEAEANLPPLIERDGIMLHMNDLTLPVAWKFKYRFWPNNRSRMYILETTGDFVKAHGLQSGDVFINYESSPSENYIVTGEKRTQCSASANTFNRSCKKECSITGDCRSPASTTT